MIIRTGFAAPLTSAAALVFAMPLAAQSMSKQPMTAQDLVTMPRLGAPAVSHDDKWVVFPVTETAPASPRPSPGAWGAQLGAAFRRARRLRDGVRGSETPSVALDAFSGAQGGLEVSVEHMDPMRRADLVTPFADALFGASQPGLLEEPIRTSFGVHVVVLEEIIPPWEVPRDEWEPVIRRQLAAERRAEALEQLAARLAESSSIAIEPEALRLAESVPLGSDVREPSAGGR